MGQASELDRACLCSVSCVSASYAFNWRASASRVCGSVSFFSLLSTLHVIWQFCVSVAFAIFISVSLLAGLCCTGMYM